ncbi:DUF6220 domain-containing protein [Paenibacillus humicola]|uniref:DUF6220 domain-containing protein n=1 Tax=Paenibacillus humicola TaxID=3110540 RepID=UPI00237AD120|nr:DUF6220 domain-containing protein [Paenibacillus humicola]
MKTAKEPIGVKRRRPAASEREPGEQGNVRIRIFRQIYAFAAAAYLVCIILQVFFAGLGIFVDSGELQLHRAFANDFEFGSALMFLLSFPGQIRGGLRWWPLALLALTSLQHITIQLAAGILPAFHTVDALLLFAIAMHTAKRSWRWLLPRRSMA